MYSVVMEGQSATHASLLIRLREGAGTVAWNEFHERYGGLIRRFAHRRGLQPADCEDVAQEVLLSLSKVMPDFQYDPGKGKFRSYLKTATLHAIFRKSFQKRGEVALGTIEEATRIAEADAAVNEAWELEWQRYHLRQAMQTLDSEFNRTDREAFRRYAIEDASAQETAAELGISVDRVYDAKSRILKRLKHVIELQVREEG
ncbi:MAG: sigma-70 family RNA polymerase sigma factor [Phycisphaerales bacterium]|nr:MAG: sigma-70 family RNA polymerase sigma factor [Phycisphaerales bacterium]